jgi:hypothetical protein
MSSTTAHQTMGSKARIGELREVAETAGYRVCCTSR